MTGVVAGVPPEKELAHIDVMFDTSSFLRAENRASSASVLVLTGELKLTMRSITGFVM